MAGIWIIYLSILKFALVIIFGVHTFAVSYKLILHDW